LSDLEHAIWRPFEGEGVLVYGLHRGESRQLLADFVEQTGVTFPIVDGRDTLSGFAFPPGVNFPYPRDVVIGKDLTVRSIRNSFNAGEMRDLVERLIAE